MQRTRFQFDSDATQNRMFFSASTEKIHSLQNWFWFLVKTNLIIIVIDMAGQRIPPLIKSAAARAWMSSSWSWSRTMNASVFGTLIRCGIFNILAIFTQKKENWMQRNTNHIRSSLSCSDTTRLHTITLQPFVWCGVVLWMPFGHEFRNPKS